MIPVGQRVPAQERKHLKKENLDNLQRSCREGNFKGYITVYVASQNPIKLKAAVRAVQVWAQAYFTDSKVNWVAATTLSDVKEQPNGNAETNRGSNNRLLAIYQKFIKKIATDHINIFVGFENGIEEEKVPSISNKHVYESKPGHAFVDRCYVHAMIVFNHEHFFKASSISEGVTVPFACAEASIQSNCEKTAGRFIADQYGCEHDNWHEKVAGITRRELLSNALLAALGA